jgi:hypothetical protein
MSRYIRFLGWVLFVAASAVTVGGCVALAVTGGVGALMDYLASFGILTLAGFAAAFFPGLALIKLADRLERGGGGCDVCSAVPAAGVFSSRFGPVSHAACEDCRDEGAEPLYMVCFHIHRAGGPEAAEEFLGGARSFHQGRYIGWEDIVGLYPEFADEFDDR